MIQLQMLIKRRAQRAQQGNILILGFMASVLLLLTCIPALSAVARLTDQRVAMALASQNAAYAGTSQTDRFSPRIILAPDRTANTVATVLAENLSSDGAYVFGEGNQAFSAEIIVHNTMKEKTLLVNESQQQNRNCDPGQLTGIGVQPGIRMIEDVGTCWMDMRYGAYHRTPGVSVTLEGGLNVCASWMSSVLPATNGREKPDDCMTLVRMRTHGFADMTSENAVDDKVKLILDNIPNPLSTGEFTASWRPDRLDLAPAGSGAVATCYLRKDGGPWQSFACGDVQDSHRFPYDGSELFGPGSYQFYVQVAYDGTPASEGAPAQPPLIIKSKTDIFSVPNTVSTVRVKNLTATSVAGTQNRVTVNWTIQGTAGSVDCSYVTRRTTNPKYSAIVSQSDLPASEEGVSHPIDCASWKGVPHTMPYRLTDYTFTVQANAAAPATGSHSASVTYTSGSSRPPASLDVFINYQQVGDENPRIVVSFRWNDPWVDNGLNKQQRMDLINWSQTVCKLEQQPLSSPSGSPFTPAIGADVACQNNPADYDLSDHGLTFKRTYNVANGKTYKFSAQLTEVASLGSTRLSQSVTVNITDAGFAWIATPRVTSSAMMWQWRVTGAGATWNGADRCRFSEWSPTGNPSSPWAVVDADKLTVTGAACGQPQGSAIEEGLPRAQLTVGNLYCLDMSNGRISQSGNTTKVDAWLGFVWRAPPADPQEENCTGPLGK